MLLICSPPVTVLEQDLYKATAVIPSANRYHLTSSRTFLEAEIKAFVTANRCNRQHGWEHYTTFPLTESTVRRSRGFRMPMSVVGLNQPPRVGVPVRRSGGDLMLTDWFSRQSIKLNQYSPAVVYVFRNTFFRVLTASLIEPGCR